MIDELCERTGFTLEQLKARNKEDRFVYSRYLIMEELVKQGFTLAEAGKVFRRDHATVYYGLTQLDNIRETKYPKRLYNIIQKFEGVDEKAETCKELLLRFFTFFRDRGEDYLGLTMEQFIDRFIEFENVKNRARVKYYGKKKIL